MGAESFDSLRTSHHKHELASSDAGDWIHGINKYINLRKELIKIANFSFPAFPIPIPAVVQSTDIERVTGKGTIA